MSKLQQEDMLSYYFNRSLELEELLLKKYDLPKKMMDNPILGPVVKDFKKNSREHTKDLKEKMNLLGIK